ncbi:MAG: elongation factor P [Candidatus Paceibacterota bacterium]
MLEYNEIVERKFIVYEGAPYEVIHSHVFRKQQRKPVNAVKMKNLITGKVAEVSFHVSEKVEEADISTKDVKYLYTNKGAFWFCDPAKPSDRFELSADLLGPGMQFLKPNSIVPALVFDEKIIGIKIPIKVDLKVTEAFPAVRGDTARGGNKTVKVETGASVTVPMFVKEGDILRINTETGEYTDRVN